MYININSLETVTNIIINLQDNSDFRLFFLNPTKLTHFYEKYIKSNVIKCKN